MKTKLSILIVILSMANINYAQTKMGIMAGPNLAKVIGLPEGLTTSSGVFGFINVFINLPVHENLLIQSGISYNVKGWSGMNGFYSSEKILTYIEIPATITYKFSDNSLGLTGGIYFATLANAQDIHESFWGSQYVTNTSGLNTFDFGIKTGISYDVSKKISLSINYELGLVPVFDYSSQSQGRNSVLNLGIAYSFEL